MILENIDSPFDLKRLDPGEMKILAGELREYIIDVISRNGGHLAASLGVVELTIALHRVFDTPRDRLIWDVGHQSYAHKILTGRREQFRGIRCYGGLSGFPKSGESAYDHYDTGHSSTSLSLALGEAVARDLRAEDHKVIAVIGDGSLTGGMAFEALNNIGNRTNDLIIILNDNEHSISENVGGMSTYLTRIITNTFYNRFKKSSINFVKSLPLIGQGLFKVIYRITDSLKGLLISKGELRGQFFQDLGIRYFGPVNGHDLRELTDTLEKVRNINAGPKIIHVITQKGRGYVHSEKNPAQFHGPAPFDRETGLSLEKKGGLSYSRVVGKTLAHLAVSHGEIAAITAAMKMGTGLDEFEAVAPDRFFDVGIAEQHAVTFASALANRGLRPFVSIYSTFLQRSVDQIIHDVAIMNLPVVILIDRSGLVGDDGETHHGLFDIAIFRNIPNMTLLAPSNGSELRDMLYYSLTSPGPVAIRFPRGSIPEKEIDFSRPEPFVPGKIMELSRGRELSIFFAGEMRKTAEELRTKLESDGISAGVINLLSIKPLDAEGIEEIIGRTEYFICIECGVLSGGAGEYILSSVSPAARDKLIACYGFPDRFIPHGSTEHLLKDSGLDTESIYNSVMLRLKNDGKKVYKSG